MNLPKRIVSVVALTWLLVGVAVAATPQEAVQSPILTDD